MSVEQAMKLCNYVLVFLIVWTYGQFFPKMLVCKIEMSWHWTGSDNDSLKSQTAATTWNSCSAFKNLCLWSVWNPDDQGVLICLRDWKVKLVDKWIDLFSSILNLKKKWKIWFNLSLFSKHLINSYKSTYWVISNQMGECWASVFQNYLEIS